MSASGQHSSCAYPESLVLIEALPLCRVGVSDDLRCGASSESPSGGAGGDPFGQSTDLGLEQERSLRRAAVMSCAEAFALLEEVGHVAW